MENEERVVDVPEVLRAVASMAAIVAFATAVVAVIWAEWRLLRVSLTVLAAYFFILVVKVYIKDLLKRWSSQE